MGFRARAFQWPPLRLARLRCERGSVDVVCPPVLQLPVTDERGTKLRAVALDVHRDFCEVAIVEGGELRSGGRIETKPETLELFAQSLDVHDRRRARGDRQRLGDRAHPGAARRARDRGRRHQTPASARRGPRPTASMPARSRSCSGRAQLDAVWMPDERIRAMRRRLARRDPARARPHAREERDPRRADALPEGAAAGVRPVRRQGQALARGAGAPASPSARPSTPPCARWSSSTQRSPRSRR